MHDKSLFYIAIHILHFFFLPFLPLPPHPHPCKILYCIVYLCLAVLTTYYVCLYVCLPACYQLNISTCIKLCKYKTFYMHIHMYTRQITYPWDSSKHLKSNLILVQSLAAMQPCRALRHHNDHRQLPSPPMITTQQHHPQYHTTNTNHVQLITNTNTIKFFLVIDPGLLLQQIAFIRINISMQIIHLYALYTNTGHKHIVIEMTVILKYKNAHNIYICTY